LEFLVRRFFAPDIVFGQLPIVLSGEVKCLPAEMNPEPPDELKDLLAFSNDLALKEFVGHRRIGTHKEFQVRSLSFGD